MSRRFKYNKEQKYSRPNTWRQKFKRTVTSVLPVSEHREGDCLRCGECCKLPNACPFLAWDGELSYCKVHQYRPLQCRKYPRVQEEQICVPCGYQFKISSSEELSEKFDPETKA